MLHRCFLLLAVSLCFIAAAPPSPAQTPASKEPFSEIEGSVTIAGAKIEYKATTGRLNVADLTGKAKANLFFIAYTRKMDGKPGNRPVTFCFNGGPGSASLWLHLGLLGPRRVLIDEDGKSLPLPAKMIDNEWSVLDLTDLVFIDPVSTGYSRSEDPKDAKLFHGLEEDTQSVGDFIRAYAAKYDRAASPAYIAGESYGTTRSASLSSYIQGRGGVKLAGIILISTVLDWQTIRFDVDNDMPYPLFLPTYTAAAWHHKKLDRGNNLPAILEEAEQFANGPYAGALRKGNLLGDDERKSIAKTMAKFIGLSEEFVLKADLRVEVGRFRSELLRDAGELIGRYDSRVKAKVKGGKGKGGGGGDPSNTLLSGAFGESIKKYLTAELKYDPDLKYNTLAPVQPWSYGKAGTNRYANIAPRLRAAMQKDLKLRVFVASGYSDLATPYSATKYTFAHLGPRSLMDRVTMMYYESGHMMYSHQPSLRKLRDDLRKFIVSEPAKGG